MESSWLRVSISSRLALSSAECASASLAMRSTSSLLRPEEDVIVIFWSLFVALSFAVTLRMPFASISNVTSICGTPRGAGGNPVRWNLPKVRFWAARDRWSGHPTERFDRQGERSHIQQEQILDVALEHTALNRRSNRHDFIRV